MMSTFQWPPRRRLVELYRDSFDDMRRERMFLSGLSFFITFGAVRAVTGVQRHKSGPFGGKDQKVHHYVYGIFVLLTTGYSWLFQGGREGSRHRKPARSTTIGYGVASALVIDEMNIWLHVKNDYWKAPIRQVIDAVVLGLSLLSVGAWGRAFFTAVFRDATGHPADGQAEA